MFRQIDPNAQHAGESLIRFHSFRENSAQLAFVDDDIIGPLDVCLQAARIQQRIDNRERCHQCNE